MPATFGVGMTGETAESRPDAMRIEVELRFRGMVGVAGEADGND